MSLVRTFIAVELAESMRRRAACLAERLAQDGVKVKWVAPANMHLTLKFLGEVQQEKTAAVCEVVAEEVREIPAFDVDCVGAGAFPSPARPSTIWIGIGQGTEQLGRLHTAIDKRLAQLGFPREGRRYRPHLTVGRVRGGGRATNNLANLVRQNAGFEAGTCRVCKVITFASELTPKGPVYTALGNAPLANPADDASRPNSATRG